MRQLAIVVINFKLWIIFLGPYSKEGLYCFRKIDISQHVQEALNLWHHDSHTDCSINVIYYLNLEAYLRVSTHATVIAMMAYKHLTLF